MARSGASSDSKSSPGLDRTVTAPAQAEAEDWTEGAVHRGRLRVRTLVTLRWMVAAGEAVLLLAMAIGLGLKAPYTLCFAVVGAGAWLNLMTGVASPGQRMFGDREAAAQLSADIAQMSALVFLTGGAGNPFMLMLIAPVTLAAATLPLRPVLLLGAFAALAAIVMAFYSLPLPVANGMSVVAQLSYRIGAAIAVIAGLGLTAGYVRQAAVESARMALALDVTQAVLAREQRLSALGALAAAAAHELGTPLATISIVAKELARNSPVGPLKEDADLLITQAERCRDILFRLTRAPEATDAVHERMSLLQVVQEAIAPHARRPDVRVEAVVSGPHGEPAPEIWRLAEVLHALTAFVENAVDFAKSEILVTARFDPRHIAVEVRDDGPGFSPEVMTKLGEPYVTSRPGEAMRSGHVGMGLGFFIAKTLLERTGALVDFRNGRRGGAVITARWRREAIEAPALPDVFADPTGVDDPHQGATE